jgi:hypothetical protein
MHYNFHTRTESVTTDYLHRAEPLRVLITSGASCPDAVVESVIARLVSFFPGSRSIEDVREEFATSGANDNASPETSQLNSPMPPATQRSTS